MFDRLGDDLVGLTTNNTILADDERGNASDTDRARFFLYGVYPLEIPFCCHCLEDSFWLQSGTERDSLQVLLIFQILAFPPARKMDDEELLQCTSLFQLRTKLDTLGHCSFILLRG